MIKKFIDRASALMQSLTGVKPIAGSRFSRRAGWRRGNGDAIRDVLSNNWGVMHRRTTDPDGASNALGLGADPCDPPLHRPVKADRMNP
jgi:hypothetical protein